MKCTVQSTIIKLHAIPTESCEEIRKNVKYDAGLFGLYYSKWADKKEYIFNKKEFEENLFSRYYF